MLTIRVRSAHECPWAARVFRMRDADTATLFGRLARRLGYRHGMAAWRPLSISGYEAWPAVEPYENGAATAGQTRYIITFEER